MLERLEASRAVHGAVKEGEHLTFEHVVGNVRNLHLDIANAGAVFQVASQFNCLEMVGPSVKPEAGITRYENDHTQGPTCSIACPAATLFRNYFSRDGKGQFGGDDCQLDMLNVVGLVVDNANNHYWRQSNGYALPASKESIGLLSARIDNEQALGLVMQRSLRLGIHWDTREICHHLCVYVLVDLYTAINNLPTVE
mgnify:CR=1 FL=1